MDSYVGPCDVLSRPVSSLVCEFPCGWSLCSVFFQSPRSSVRAVLSLCTYRMGSINACVESLHMAITSKLDGWMDRKHLLHTVSSPHSPWLHLLACLCQAAALLALSSLGPPSLTTRTMVLNPKPVYNCLNVNKHLPTPTARKGIWFAFPFGTFSLRQLQHSFPTVSSTGHPFASSFFMVWFAPFLMSSDL